MTTEPATAKDGTGDGGGAPVSYAEAVTAAIARTSSHAAAAVWAMAGGTTVGSLLARKELITSAVLAAIPVIEERFTTAAQAELAEPLRELGAQIATRAAETERLRWLTVLTRHYLMGTTHTNAAVQATCGCKADLGWLPSPGDARQSWIDHVAAVVAGEQQ